MALTLREILDKARADREAKEARPETPVASVAPPRENPVMAPTAIPPQVSPSPSQQAKQGGLLARLSGVSNVAQSQAPSPPPSVAAEAIPSPSQGTNGAAQSEIVLAVAIPTFTGEETDILRKNLAFLAANLDEKEVIGQVLRTTVRQIQEHPELSAIMIDSDFDLIVAAARRSMKFTARKKEERVDKREKKSAQKDELNAWLKDQGIEL